MPILRTTTVTQHQVLILFKQGKSIRKIAQALALSRNTVRSILRGNGDVALDDDDKPLGLEQTVSAKLIPSWATPLDWEGILLAIKRGRTMLDLFSEHELPISYSTFCRQVRHHLKKPIKTSMRLEHQPGEKTFVDYADGIDIINQETGEKRKTHLFCGVLPFSSYTFGEFVFDQKQASFIESHEKMWRFFGGVTPYVVCDNLKAGVTKAHRYDPDVNRTYCEYANHCGFAVLPARPYTPRDKAAVEAAIGVIQRGFYSEVKERSFYSLSELNEVFSTYLCSLNAKVMKDHGVSRTERFIHECSLLQSLPKTSYEISDWRDAIVHPDCHIQVLKNFYSVPFRLVGQTVKVRVRPRTVEIFSEDLEALASHIRQSGVGNKSTLPGHEPETRDQMKSFNIRSALEEAKRLTPKLGELIEQMFACERPLRRLRAAQGIIRVAKSPRYSRPSIDYAASQALTFQRFRTRYFADCAASYRPLELKALDKAPQRSAEEIFIHNQRS